MKDKQMRDEAKNINKEREPEDKTEDENMEPTSM